MGTGGGELGFGTGAIGAGTKLGVDEGGGGADDDLGAVHGGLGGLRGLLRGGQREECVGGGRGDFELGAFADGLGIAALGGRGLDIGAAEPEIEGLPGDQHADGAAPGGAQIVSTEHGSRHGRDDALREQQAEDIVAGGAIGLSQGVDARQIRGAGEGDGGGGGLRLLLGDANGRVVALGGIDGLGQGQGLGVEDCEQRGEHQRGVVSHEAPSISSRNNSCTFPQAAWRAFRPCGVAW